MADRDPAEKGGSWLSRRTFSLWVLDATCGPTASRFSYAQLEGEPRIFVTLSKGSYHFRTFALLKSNCVVILLLPLLPTPTKRIVRFFNNKKLLAHQDTLGVLAGCIKRSTSLARTPLEFIQNFITGA